MLLYEDPVGGGVPVFDLVHCDRVSVQLFQKSMLCSGLHEWIISFSYCT